MRRFWLSLIALTLILAGYSYGQGPLTNALNLLVRTDSSGSLYVYGVVAGAQGPLRNFANTTLRTYGSSSALGVTVAGGTITPDNLCMSATTQDSYFAEIGANNPGAYTGGTSCAGGTLRFDWNATRFNIANALSIGATVASAGDIRLTSSASIKFRNSANAADFVGITLNADNLNIGDTNNAATVVSSSFQINPATAFINNISTYKNVTTAGWGVPAVYANGNVAAAVNVGTASIATYTVGAADGTFEVGCNFLITTSTTHSFSCDVVYTDEGSSSRTMIMPMQQLGGSFITGGLVTNVTGAGPYEAPVMTIRCKASTSITIRTSSGGTFTTVTYNARGVIKQVG